MKIIEIKADTRKELGKGKVKKLRKAKKIPVVIYGEGSQPLTIDSMDALKLYQHRHENFLIKLSIDGSKEKKALLKDIQMDPVQNVVTHLDFLELVAGKTIKAKIPLSLEGVPEGVKAGGLIQHFLWEVNIECMPEKIPDNVTIDISKLKVGDSIHVRDVKVGEGLKVVDKANQVILTIGLPTGVIEEREAAAKAAAEAAIAAEAAEAAAAAAEAAGEDGAPKAAPGAAGAEAAAAEAGKDKKPGEADAKGKKPGAADAAKGKKAAPEDKTKKR